MHNQEMYMKLEKVAEKIMDSIKKDALDKEKLHKQLSEDFKNMPIPVCQDNDRMAFEKWYSEKYGVSPFGRLDGVYNHLIVKTSFDAWQARGELNKTYFSGTDSV